MHDTIHTVHITHTAHSERGTEGATSSKVSLRSKDLKFLHLDKMAKEVAYVHTVYSERRALRAEGFVYSLT
jgi:hypothetical protein